MSEERSRFKFRVWDKGEQKMSPVANISFGDDGSARTICIYAAPHNYKQVHLIVEGENGVLMQWTGKTDQHGTPIYDGDIVVTTNEQQEDEPVEEQYRGVVTYDEGFYFIQQPESRYQPMLSNYTIVSIEVLGNIYEHAHLLEKKEASE